MGDGMPSFPSLLQSADAGAYRDRVNNEHKDHKEHKASMASKANKATKAVMD